MRQARFGLSAAYDYQGRQLAIMDQFHTSDYTLVAGVPALGTRTLYGRWGDWFAWLAIAGWLGLMAVLVTRTKRLPAA